MHVATVKISALYTDGLETQDARLAFWNRTPVREAQLRERERRFRVEFAENLTRYLQDQLREFHLLSFRGARLSEQDKRILRKIDRAQFRVEAIWYGSLNVELGIPDIESVLELIGNNSELLEVVLQDYVPSAFSSATDAEANEFDFRTDMSRGLKAYLESRQGQGAPPGRPYVPVRTEGDDSKRKGLKIAAEVLKSPLIFPVILICFLWYMARQDQMAERQLMVGLMQSLLQQQTATFALLRDVAVKEAKDQEKKIPTKNEGPDNAELTKPK